jgi:hypothetical protein
MTKSTMTPALITLFGLLLILLIQVSSLCLLIHFAMFSERGSGRITAKTETTEAPSPGDGRRDA